MKVPSLLDPNGRRWWAFAALLGGSVVMTIFASVALWLVSNEAEYSFGLGLAAMAIIALIISGFVALFVKRTVKIGRDGIEMSDQTDAPAAAQAVADTAQETADEIKDAVR